MGSGATGWGQEGPNGVGRVSMGSGAMGWDQELWVGVRRVPMGSGGSQWGQEGPNGVGRVPMGSGGPPRVAAISHDHHTPPYPAPFFPPQGSAR